MDTADISISTNGRDRRDPNQQNQRSVEANWCTGIYPTDFFYRQCITHLKMVKVGNTLTVKKNQSGKFSDREQVPLVIGV